MAEVAPVQPLDSDSRSLPSPPGSLRGAPASGASTLALAKEALSEVVEPRFEVKCWASEAEAAALVRVASHHMQVDPYCRDGAQRNISLYFDSPNLTFYEQHVAGAPRRAKLRIRTYEDQKGPAFAFLEVKRRNKGMTMKSRAIVPRAVAEAFAIGDRGALDRLPESPELRDFAFHVHAYLLGPSILVSARRLAMASLGDDAAFRMTLDREIRFQAPVLPGGRVARADAPLALAGRTGAWTPVDVAARSGLGAKCVLIELKFRAALPAWLSPALSNLGLRQTSFSKYVAAIGQSRSDWGFPHALRGGVP